MLILHSMTELATWTPTSVCVLHVPEAQDGRNPWVRAATPLPDLKGVTVGMPFPL